MGLIFAAMAGYDPANAVTFWQRMASATNGSRTEVLSDHPSDERRSGCPKQRSITMAIDPKVCLQHQVLEPFTLVLVRRIVLVRDAKHRLFVP